MKTSDSRRGAAMATAFFVALTLALTWPLAHGLTRDVPSDFGDPLLNSWILAWDATHLGAGRGWWNANIFYPHPYALAYSEHLFAQALQILPIYALTRNPILCYNLLFLSTFVLSGLGMFLFVRELTDDVTAGMIGGLAFAFAPYRVTALPHLQVLSSAWMPFALFGFRRYFVTRRAGPLAGAAVAWLLQNLSCGYYLLFFSPVVIVYVVWEMTTRHLWGNRRVLISLAAAAGAVALATAPFLWTYFELRRLGFGPRSLAQARQFSADVYGYLTADPNLRFWGSIARAWPKAEGALFPGVTITGLALLAATRGFSRTMWIVLALCSLIVLALLLGYSIRLPFLKITSFSRALIGATALIMTLLAVSRSERAAVIRWLGSPAGFFTLVTLFAVAMSFGPQIEAKGRVVMEATPYRGFYSFVPGFDGLRVPARFGMLVTLGLAVLAPLALMSTGSPRRRAQMAAAAAALMILESFAAPIPINQNSTDYRQAGLAPLPGSLGTEMAGMAGAPAVYRYIADLPDSSAILELPLGEPAFDIRYMFYSIRHWRPLVNGYSGGEPGDYDGLNQALQDLISRPERAWQTLLDSRATYVIVHESFYAGDRGPRVSGWLRMHHAAEVASFDADRVFRVPNR